MKKTLPIIAIAAFFAACTSTPKTSETTGTNAQSDTAGLADYKQWKEQQSTFHTPGVSEVAEEYSAVEPEPSKAVTYSATPVTKAPAAKVAKPAVKRAAPQPVVQRPVRQSPPVAQERPAVYRGSESNGSSSSTSTSPSTTGSGGTSVGKEEPVIVAKETEPTEQKKEGWSKAAQGAAIGGGSGAVAGAIISKNKAKGAVIGGIIGAGAGYVLGRKQDKKDGRY